MKEDRRYPPTHTLKQLQNSLRTDEPWWGAIQALQIVGDYSVATLERPSLRRRPVTLLPMIGDSAPPAPAGTSLVLTGTALIKSQAMKIAVFRKDA
jgi:hypothetical protein